MSALSSQTSGGVHGLPACVEHVPLLHVSAPSQNKPSLQAVPFGLYELLGHRMLDPVQVSAMSHWTSTAARHTVPFGL